MRVRGFAPATPCWAQLSTPDPGAVVGFYEGLFDWRAETTDVGLTIFRLGDLAVAGATTGAPDQHPVWMTYIATDDVDATTDTASTAGGSVVAPAAALGDLGRHALVADAEGAVFGVWHRGTFQGAQVVSEAGAVSWNELASRDPASARDFYQRTLGWTDHDPVFDTGYDYREWYADNRTVAGLTPMDGQYPDDIPPHWRTIVETHDCAGLVDRCGELGGVVQFGPLDVGVGQYAQLSDPSGGSFGVVELLPELRVT